MFNTKRINELEKRFLELEQKVFNLELTRTTNIELNQRIDKLVNGFFNEAVENYLVQPFKIKKVSGKANKNKK